MKKTPIMLGLLLTCMLWSGCGREINPDTNNSSVVQNTTQPTPITDSVQGTMITEQEAKQIALEKVPQATEKDIFKFKKDTDDFIVKYEGEIHYDGKEFEFEINAHDGNILEWDEEPLRN